MKNPMRISVIFLVIHELCHMTSGQTTSFEGVEMYMLAFMNVSTDNPSLLSYESINFNAFDAYTLTRATTYSGIVDERTLLPVMGDGTGNIGYQYRTSADLVGSKEETITSHGLFVVADKKISLQASKSVQQSTDGYQAIPLTKESKEFYIMSYDEIPEGHSTFSIAAVEDYTCVEVFRVNGSEKIRMDIITLDSYQVYNGLSQMMEYTGIYISSSKPVSVFGGHECAEIPVNKLFCDLMIAQMPPVSEWGMEFVVPPILGRLATAGYEIRVVVANDETEVTIEAHNDNITNTYVINRGVDFVQAVVNDTSSPAIVKCSAPCLGMMYNRGYRAPGHGVSESLTDPFMMLLPSFDNYEYTVRMGTTQFIALNKRHDFANYAAIVVPTADISEIKYDLQPVTSDWIDLSNDWSVTAFPTTPGLHNIRSDSGMVPMMGFLYGHGTTYKTGYGYPGGFNVTGEKMTFTRLQVVSGVGPGSIDTSGDNDVVGTCENPFDPSQVQASHTIQVIYLTFDLKTPRNEPCASKVLEGFRGVLNSIVNETNWLICLDLLCIPAESTWVYDITIVEPETLNPLSSITFRVRLWNSATEVIKNAVACKRHVADYLGDFGNYTQRWHSPLNVGEPCDPPDAELVGPAELETPKNWGCVGA